MLKQRQRPVNPIRILSGIPIINVGMTHEFSDCEWSRFKIVCRAESKARENRHRELNRVVTSGRTLEIRILSNAPPSTILPRLPGQCVPIRSVMFAMGRSGPALTEKMADIAAGPANAKSVKRAAQVAVNQTAGGREDVNHANSSKSRSLNY